MSLAVAIAVIGLTALYLSRLIWRMLLGAAKLAMLAALVTFVMTAELPKNKKVVRQEAPPTVQSLHAPQAPQAVPRIADILALAEEMHRKFSEYDLQVELRHNSERTY